METTSLTTVSRIVPPLKTHGGKYFLASRIHDLAKDLAYKHRVYVYGGGMGEAWNWDYEGVSECYNDVDKRLTNFFRVLQEKVWFEEFKRRVEAIPFSQVEWETAANDHHVPITDWSDLDQAIKFFILVRQSLAGRCKSFAPSSRSRTRRGMNEQASAWLGAVEGLHDVHRRLIRMYISNLDGLACITKEDSKDTLFYLDPPYFPDTRTAPNVYAHEMTVDQHIDLLAHLPKIQGKFLLSGYHNAVYDQVAHENDWKVHEYELPNSAAGGDKKRRMKEVLWSNF